MLRLSMWRSRPRLRFHCSGLTPQASLPRCLLPLRVYFDSSCIFREGGGMRRRIRSIAGFFFFFGMAKEY